jgi:hypothetical protein
MRHFRRSSVVWTLGRWEKIWNQPGASIGTERGLLKMRKQRTIMLALMATLLWVVGCSTTSAQGQE